MHIAIEGIDGVGKTTTARELSKQTGFTFIEKPLKYLLDENGSNTNYIRVRNQVNQSKNRDFTALFYGLSNVFLYEKFPNQNIITDRHLVSNYAWSYNGKNGDIYDLLVKKLGVPDFTFILFANKHTIEKRLKKRNPNDTDLYKADKHERRYELMVECCDKYDMPYMIIDTSDINEKIACEIMTEKIRSLTND